ncbi:MAG: alpha/beta hydrolase [Capsulimonas sp.]|nr:alpha/beta hydrolase [Capsulimonas sp.]
MTNTATQRCAHKIVIEAKDFLIPSDTPGIELRIRNKRLAATEPFGADRTLLLIHGATFPSESLFDVPLGGVSFMDDLAKHGYDVYALDVRGYGGSTRPAEMDQPADQNAPIVRTETAVRDLGSAVDHLLKTLYLSSINLLGMSWGGTVAGAYTSQNNDKIAKLILVAPQWLSATPAPIDKGGALGAYRVIPVPEMKERWLSAAPEHKRADLLPEGWFEQWASATIATDPSSAAQDTQTIRAPSGAVLDIRKYWTAGKPFYDPGEITSPTLLVHAEWDIDAPIDITLEFFKTLTGARFKQWVEIGEGTHMVLLEKNRGRTFSAILNFLEEEDAPV